MGGKQDGEPLVQDHVFRNKINTLIEDQVKQAERKHYYESKSYKVQCQGDHTFPLLVNKKVQKH